ncbi:hypothetical protein Pan216_54490 [Planctomycetes bacterium Pan216]|uniref:Uncharacterized protein n=1 Tax=Kolteria novifilia TaxID=2527975 RepID=A0A518BC61_9BACT|nr:hypothetical protein Pan216_54490 [Planctomycetes bacterium Pan216]
MDHEPISPEDFSDDTLDLEPVDAAEADRVIAVLTELAEEIEGTVLRRLLDATCCDIADLVPEEDEADGAEAQAA